MKRVELLRRVRKAVVKIGTASICAADGSLDEEQASRLAEQVNDLRSRGVQTAIVSSGAIGAGMQALGIKRRPRQLPELQACAAIGQNRLTAVYDRCFRRHGYHAAQMLLTRDDFNDRQRYLNASNALHAILRYGGVPIINENDTISVEEIAFGDNDGLAAMVAQLMCADLMVLMTTVDGLYENPDAAAAERRLVRVVDKVNAGVTEMANGKTSKGGTGGMTTKLNAARAVTAAGMTAVIANAREPRLLQRLFDGEEIGTLFLPVRKRKLAGHKCWLRLGTRTKGTVTVDAGARRALVEGGKSLLPSGIKEVSSDFSRGDLVGICDESGREFARGLVNYSADEIRRIMGQKSLAVRRILGDAPYDEAIHRDHLALNE